MEREQIFYHVPQLASYLDRVYFASKEPLRRGACTTRPAELYAEGLFVDNKRSREGYENSLSGYLAEPLFVTLLRELSPQGFLANTSGKDRDDNNGCDVEVIQNGETIGGFSVKSGEASYARRKSSRIKEFPVVTVLMQHVGAKELVASLQAGELPDPEELVRNKLYSAEGREMREQLYNQLIKHLSSVPQGPFRDYLVQVAQRVGLLHHRLAA